MMTAQNEPMGYQGSLVNELQRLSDEEFSQLYVSDTPFPRELLEQERRRRQMLRREATMRMAQESPSLRALVQPGGGRPGVPSAEGLRQPGGGMPGVRSLEGMAQPGGMPGAGRALPALVDPSQILPPAPLHSLEGMAQPGGGMPSGPMALADGPGGMIDFRQDYENARVPSAGIGGGIPEWSPVSPAIAAAGPPQGGPAGGGYSSGGMGMDGAEESPATQAILEGVSAANSVAGPTEPPSPLDETQDVLREMLKGGISPADKDLALASAGFGIAAGRSPSAIQNIGQGALVGLQSYRDLRREALTKQLAAARQLESDARTRELVQQRREAAQDRALNRELYLRVQQQNANTQERRAAESERQHRERLAAEAPEREARTAAHWAQAGLRDVQTEAGGFRPARPGEAGNALTRGVEELVRTGVVENTPEGRERAITLLRPQKGADRTEQERKLAATMLNAESIPGRPVTKEQMDDIGRRAKAMMDAIYQPSGGAPPTAAPTAAPGPQKPQQGAQPAAADGGARGKMINDAKAALAAGAPRAQVEERLRQMGIDPAELGR